MRIVGGCSLMIYCFPIVTYFLQQCIELDLMLIFEVIPVEELSCLLIEPGSLCSCERSCHLEYQVALSSLRLRSKTQLYFLKSGLMLQSSWWVRWCVNTQ